MPDKKEDKKEHEKENEEDSKTKKKKEVDVEEIEPEPEPEPTLKEILESLDKKELIVQILELTEKSENLEKNLKEQKDWKQKFMFLQAEFENAQKRWEKTRSEVRLQSEAFVIKSFLSLYDSFKKAIDSDPKAEILKQFYSQFMNLLKSYKAEPMAIKKEDKFDYNYHEALTSLEIEQLPENSIVDIIQDGWMMGKDVLRYAKVVISKKPKPPEPEPEPTPAEPVELNEDSDKEVEQSTETSEASNSDKKE